MAQFRVVPAALVLTIVMALLVGWLVPVNVYGEATHSGTWAVNEFGGAFIYAANPSTPAAVLFTLCQTSGPSQAPVLVDGTQVAVTAGCKTLNLAPSSTINIGATGAGGAAAGDYTISVDLAAGRAPR